MTAGRVLNSDDVGRVFVRVDPDGQRGEYLCLRSLGTGSTPIASFVIFRVADGVAQGVGDTGYFNGPWYKEVHEFSEPFIADVLGRHERHVEERLVELSEAAVAEEQTNQQLRVRFGKPALWISLGDGRTGGDVSQEYVVWYDPENSRYAIEVYGPAEELLASRHLECSHEPLFGMDTLDFQRIFGQPGELSQLVARVEHE